MSRPRKIRWSVLSLHIALTGACTMEGPKFDEPPFATTYYLRGEHELRDGGVEEAAASVCRCKKQHEGHETTAFDIDAAVVSGGHDAGHSCMCNHHDGGSCPHHDGGACSCSNHEPAATHGALGTHASQIVRK